MEPIKCDICGEEIPTQDLDVSGGKPLRFCKECKKGLSDGLLPTSANRPSDGLLPRSLEKAQDGLYPAETKRNDGLYPGKPEDDDGLLEPEE
jgi:ribosome-binding protein aMBF1 (putative translation factor)